MSTPENTSTCDMRKDTRAREKSYGGPCSAPTTHTFTHEMKGRFAMRRRARMTRARRQNSVKNNRPLRSYCDAPSTLCTGARVSKYGTAGALGGTANRKMRTPSDIRLVRRQSGPTNSSTTRHKQQKRSTLSGGHHRTTRTRHQTHQVSFGLSQAARTLP